MQTRRAFLLAVAAVPLAAVNVRQALRPNYVEDRVTGFRMRLIEAWEPKAEYWYAADLYADDLARRFVVKA